MSHLAMRLVGRAAGAALRRSAGPGPAAGVVAAPISSRRAPPARSLLPRLASTATDAAAAAAAPSTSSPTPQWPPSARIAMLYDSDCPLCMREVGMLRRRDAGAGKIWFVDVADPGYEAGPGAAFGVPYETAMATIHGVEREGNRVISGVDVFARLYESVGLGWVYGFLKVPALKRAAAAAYKVWADYRLPLTGRDTLEVVLAERKACRAPPPGSDK